MSYQSESIPEQEKVKTSGAPAVQVADEITEGVTTELLEILDADNICEYLGENKLKEFANELNEGIALDKQSMTSYINRHERAIRLAKMDPEHKDKTFPFVGASNLMSPYVFEAALDFSARATPMLLERRDICKIDIHGSDPDGAKRQRGDRVAMAVNQDLRVGIKGWRDSQDKALLLLAIVGTYFKKTYQCPSENKRKSELIYPDKLVFDHSSDRFEESPRKSYEYRMRKNDVMTAIRTGEFTDIDMEQYKDEDEICFMESHCWLDLDDDGYSEPYIVNLEKDGGNKIVSIVPRFDEDDIMLNEDGEVAKISEENFFTQTIFIPDPTGSCMGMGWGILLGDTFEAINTHMRQLTDAGTLQNISANSGFIRTGSVLSGASRKKKGNIKMQMGQFTSLESSGTGPLSQDIAQFPFAGPSQTLYQLMEALKAEVRQMTSSSQIMEGHAGEAAEKYLARLQQSMVTPNSIMIRVFSGVTKELKRIYEVMGKYLGQEEYADLVDDPNADWAADFAEDYEICTTADPSQGSEQERLARSKIVFDISMMTPAMDARVALGDYLDALGVKNIEELLPPPQPNQPDPLAEQQMQVMEKMTEAEMISSQAKMMQAQAKMLESNISLHKMDSEIQKLEAEALKTLSDVDKNEHDARLKELKEFREDFKLNLDANMKVLNDYQIKRDAEDARRRDQAVAQSGGVQDIRTSDEGMPRKTMPRPN